MKKLIAIFILFLCFSMPVYSAHLYREDYYQNQWCSKWHGIKEYQLSDKTRVDCLTKNYAVEFDFAPKWAEAIGQSLHYSKMTDKKPAIILIIEKPQDFTYYNKIKSLCLSHGITLWYIKSPTYFYYSKLTMLFNIRSI